MYDKKVAEHKAEQNEILSQMQAHSDADHDFYLTANKVFNLARLAAEIFDSSETHEKRQLLNFLVQNCTLSGQKLRFYLREPFDVILEANKRSAPRVGLELPLQPQGSPNGDVDADC